MSDDAARVRIGFKNVLGANWTRRAHPWRRRVPLLRRELLGPEGMKASVYFLVEVNGWGQRFSLWRMLRGWNAVRSRSKNNAYSDPGVHRIVRRLELPLGSTTTQNRRVTIVAYEHRATGIVWTAAVTHLSSSVTSTPEKARQSRAVEARELVRLCREHDVDLIAADVNNTRVDPDTPRGIIEAAGFRDWRHLVEVANADYNTHYVLGEPPPREGKHLDVLYFGPRVTPIDGRVQITEPGSSDHFGLVCTVAIAP